MKKNETILVCNHTSMDSIVIELMGARNAQIQAENAVFLERFRLAMERERKNIDFLQLRKNLQDAMMSNVCRSSVSTRIELDIDDIFSAKNTTPVNFTFLDFRGAVHRYSKGARDVDSDTVKAFKEYILTTEPTLQGIRKEIRQYFPAAKIGAILFMQYGPTCCICIDILYSIQKLCTDDGLIMSVEPVKNDFGNIQW